MQRPPAMLGIIRYKRPVPLLIAAATTLAITLAALMVGAPSAQASASGCTQLGKWRTDYVCIDVRGDGLDVDTAKASFAAPAATPCNTRLYITFFDLNNRKYDQRISSLESRCLASRDYTQTYNKAMLPGRACGAVSIGGSLKPGACVSIHR